METQILDLVNLTNECFRKMILKWRPTRDNVVDIKIVANYLHRIPVKQLNEILYYLILHSVYWDGRIANNLLAGHVAIFLLNFFELELILNFEGVGFDLQLLLDICGFKIKNVEVLQLPFYSSLPLHLCRRIVCLLPNLIKLNLSTVNVTDEEMKYIAQLPLEELDVTCTKISNKGIFNLCTAEGKIKKTLRILKIEDTYVSELGSIFVLKFMHSIEDLGVCSSWLSVLANEMTEKKLFNIRKLRFNATFDKAEDQLKIAVKICPHVTTIDLATNRFTSAILKLLAQFAKLTYLNLNDCTFKFKRVRFVNEVVSNQVECLHNLKFSNLKELSIRDTFNTWFQTGRFTALISSCPVLEKLSIKDSDGFNDQMALNVSKVFANRNLKEIYIDKCYKLHESGVFDLMKIKSLKECTINFKNNRIEKYYSSLFPLCALVFEEDELYNDS